MADLWQGSRSFGPQHTPASSAVLLLHGLGSNADDLIELAPLLARYLPQSIFYSPNAPQPCDLAPVGRQWFSLQDWSPAKLDAGVQQGAAALNDLIEQTLAKTGLPTHKLALLGFSQGAMIALEVAPRRAPALGAVVACSGALIAPQRLAAEILARPPVLLTHGQLDSVVPYAALPAAQAALQLAGFAVQTCSRPQLAHGIDEDVIAAAGAFLAAHLNA